MFDGVVTKGQASGKPVTRWILSPNQFPFSITYEDKTKTKPSTFVKFVNKFVGSANFTNILSFWKGFTCLGIQFSRRRSKGNKPGAMV